MDEVKCKHKSDKPNDETFLLLSTSLSSLSSSPFTTHSNAIISPNTNQYVDATPTPPLLPLTTASTSTSTATTLADTAITIASDQRNNRQTTTTATTCIVTNTMPLLSKSTTIVHTCCYKHHCQLKLPVEQSTGTSKKLLLSIPLQRKRKRVVYNRDFCGAIGLDNRNSTVLDLAKEQRLVIAHYSCVEKFTNTMYTPTPQNDGISQSTNTEQQQQHLVSSMDKNLVDNFKVQRLSSVSPMSDEGLANASPYCSSGEEAEEEPRISEKVHEKVERSSSSDSALGLDEEILAGIADLAPRNQQRRMTLTVTDIPLRPALLPVAEPTTLPDSPLLPNAAASGADFNPSNVQSPVVVPSKMILEARIVEIPTSPTSPATTAHIPQVENRTANSRRESCVSDTDEIPNVRFVRTPSVVVSDYSDDVVCGITLEELEFFRKQRKLSLGTALDSAHSSSANDYLSDMSAASSCSNLNSFCGSSISLLDEHYGTTTATSSICTTPERKMSNCSTCSTGQDDDNNENIADDNDEMNRHKFPNNLIDALKLQERQKKVCKCHNNYNNTSLPPE